MIVRIKASRPVYRRLGVVFGKKPLDFAGDRFTEAELEALQADPVLTVSVVDGELSVDTESAGSGGQVPAGGSASAEPATPPAPKPDKPAAAPAKPKDKGSAKPGPRAKATAKAANPAASADKDEQPAGDGANSSAKPAEDSGAGAGQE